MNSLVKHLVAEVRAPFAESAARMFECQAMVKVPAVPGGRVQLELWKHDDLLLTIFSSSESWTKTQFTLWALSEDVARGYFSLQLFSDREIDGVDVEVLDVKPVDAQQTDKAALIQVGVDRARSVVHSFDQLEYKSLVTDFVAKIQEKIAEARPFSLIRLGDGEGRLLGYPNVFSLGEVVDECIRYQFGGASLVELKRNVGRVGVEDGIVQIQKLLGFSVATADMVCLPSPFHFRSGITWENLNSACGLACATIFGAKVCASLRSPIYDTFIFHAVHQFGFFPTLLSGLPFVGMVSHSDIGPVVSQEFGIPEVQTTLIPGHKSFLDSGGLHFPNEFWGIADSIRVPFPGAVFLVSAGYLGKYYCAKIKEKGGCALDIGSVFDAWSGRGRPDVLALNHLPRLSGAS